MELIRGYKPATDVENAFARAKYKMLRKELGLSTKVGDGRAVRPRLPFEQMTEKQRKRRIYNQRAYLKRTGRKAA